MQKKLYSLWFELISLHTLHTDRIVPLFGRIYNRGKLKEHQVDMQQKIGFLRVIPSRCGVQKSRTKDIHFPNHCVNLGPCFPSQLNNRQIMLLSLSFCWYQFKHFWRPHYTHYTTATYFIYRINNLSCLESAVWNLTAELSTATSTTRSL